MELKDLGNRNSIELPENLQGNIRITIRGNDNKIKIGTGSRVPNLIIDIRNNNSEVIIGQGCAIIGEFTCVASHTKIYVGDKTSMQGVKIILHEVAVVKIGVDCMFAANIRIIPSDMHSIIDIASGTRINPAGDIVIEDHVWVGYDVQLLKNITIGTNSVIGTGAVVTRDIPKNSVAVGLPARVIRSGITWDRKLLPINAERNT